MGEKRKITRENDVFLCGRARNLSNMSMTLPRLRTSAVAKARSGSCKQHEDYGLHDRITALHPDMAHGQSRKTTFSDAGNLNSDRTLLAPHGFNAYKAQRAKRL